MGNLAGWHLMIVLAVLTVGALAVWGVYWLVRLAARHGVADRAASQRP